MRVCSGVPRMRRAGPFLFWVVGLCVVVPPSWGAPRFGRPGTYAVDGSPVSIASGAIDAQAGHDVVTANEAGAEGPSLSILLNRGQGSFFAEQRVNVDASTYILHAVASGDFNGDGTADLAAAVDDITAFPIRASVLVYLSNGRGGFANPVVYRLNGFFPRCITAADLTGDDALDLVIGFAQSGGAQGLVTTLVGQRNAAGPTGAFSTTNTAVVGTAPSAIAVGDLDLDGRLDALIADRDGGRAFVMYGSGTAATPLGAPAVLANAAAPVAALVNAVPGAPLPQALVVSRTSGRLLTLAQSAPRTFATPVEQRVGFLPEAAGLADVDDNGVDDLIVLSALGAELWSGAANGTFTFAESIVGNDATLDGLAIADFNDDGMPDIAASASTQDRVTIVLNGADVPSTPAPAATSTATPVASATPTRGPLTCAGDCDGNGEVAINELIQGVNIALGNAAVATCAAFDLDGDGQIAINELIAGVNSALGGCPPPA